MKKKFLENPNLVKELKEQSLEQIEKNRANGVKKIFKEVEKVLSPYLKKSSEFELIVMDVINEKTTPIFMKKLFFGLDESVNKILQDKNSVEKNQNTHQNTQLLNIVRNVFTLILERAGNISKNLIEPTKSIIDNINATTQNKDTGAEKVMQSQNNEVITRIR